VALYQPLKGYFCLILSHYSVLVVLAKICTCGRCHNVIAGVAKNQQKYQGSLQFLDTGYCLPIQYDTMQDAILTCSQKPA